jgi:hypothetical protein
MVRSRQVAKVSASEFLKWKCLGSSNCCGLSNAEQRATVETRQQFYRDLLGSAYVNLSSGLVIIGTHGFGAYYSSPFLFPTSPGPHFTILHPIYSNPIDTEHPALCSARSFRVRQTIVDMNNILAV